MLVIETQICMNKLNLPKDMIDIIKGFILQH